MCLCNKIIVITVALFEFQYALQRTPFAPSARSQLDERIMRPPEF